MLCVKEASSPDYRYAHSADWSCPQSATDSPYSVAATPAVCYTQLAHFGETEAQVQVRSEVEHIAGGINHIVATFIGQHRMLRLKRHTCAQLILLADKAQGHGCIVVVVSDIPHTYPDCPPHALHIPWEAGLTIPNPESPANRTSSCHSHCTCTGTDS